MTTQELKSGVSALPNEMQVYLSDSLSARQWRDMKPILLQQIQNAFLASDDVFDPHIFEGMLTLNYMFYMSVPMLEFLGAIVEGKFNKNNPERILQLNAIVREAIIDFVDDTELTYWANRVLASILMANAFRYLRCKFYDSLSTPPTKLTSTEFLNQAAKYIVPAHISNADIEKYWNRSIIKTTTVLEDAQTQSRKQQRGGKNITRTRKHTHRRSHKHTLRTQKKRQ